MTSPMIPFNRPCISGNELDYVADCLRRGKISGDGFYTNQCETYMEKALGVHKVLLTTSCTHALEMASMLLNIGSGDEIIVPSFTFVSTANAFVMRGARPVFCDIRRDTLNLDERKLERLITPRTKAILPVHYAGVGCEMTEIMQIAEHHSIHVVEDNAQGLFGKYKGRFLGTFGCMSTQSFHETKNIHCGEGGALFINDSDYVERAEIVREKGTNRRRFFRGEVDTYTWVDIGSSYVPSEMLAAFLYAQLESQLKIQAHRKHVWESYYEKLRDWAEERDVRLPIVPSDCEQSYHMFYMIMPSLEQRTKLIKHLKSRGILTVFHYSPLHLSKMGQRFGPHDCPVTETISDRLVRLPFYNDLNENDQQYVISNIIDSDTGG